MSLHHGALRVFGVSPSSDANTLDAYAEGVWSPTVSSTVGTITSYTATGAYIKIGRNVFITVAATISDNGTGSGVIKIANLPFTVGPDFNVGQGIHGINVKSLSYYAYPSSSDSFARLYDGAYPVVSGDVIYLSCSYISAS